MAVTWLIAPLDICCCVLAIFSLLAEISSAFADNVSALVDNLVDNLVSALVDNLVAVVLFSPFRLKQNSKIYI